LLATLGVATVFLTAAPSGASAAPVSVTGDRTEIIVPFSFIQALAADNIQPDVVAPATISFPNFPIPLAQFPITGGLIDDSNMLGTVNNSGGQKIFKWDPPRENITHELDVLNFRIVNGNQLWGDTDGLLPGPAATLDNPSHTVNPQTGEIIYTAQAHLDAGAAAILNIYFETTVFVGGMDIGTLTSYINSPPGFPRPKAATPVSVPLVPAHNESCFIPNRTHAGPLSYGACSPTESASPVLTAGTPDANLQAANFVGSAKLTAVLGNTGTTEDEADMNISVSVTDVRNKPSLTDYEGELLLRLPTRITDMANALPSTTDFSDRATVVPANFDVVVPCSATASETIGSTCSITTSADSVAPGAVQEGKRAIWATNQIQVLDGGFDGQAATASDNSLYAIQGLFVP
jgi:hypothetical protein